MKVLITGASGTLGRELRQVFAVDDVLAPSHEELDITDRAMVHAVIATARPDVIVHAAAFTAVDRCEDEPDTAFAHNALATRYLREAAARAGAHLCYVSTDYVFDGARDEPYAEWDATNPVSVYGHSKLAGEHEAGPDAAIVRTSWVCGGGTTNFVPTVLRLAAHHDELRFVADQHSRPTMAADLAPVIRRICVERRCGVVHVTNQGVASRYDLVAAILAAAGRDPARVVPIPAAELDPPPRARRPRQSVLDNAVLRIEGLPLLPDWRDSLPRVVHSLL